jgi:hypothetical protein
MLIVQISWVKMLVQTQQLQITQISLVKMLVIVQQNSNFFGDQAGYLATMQFLKFHGLEAG